MARDRWDEGEAKKFKTPLEQRVYTSRLLGADPDLVLHGGGNTSCKATARNLVGEEMEVLYIKGSGWDLATIEAPGFPAVDLAYLRKLRALDALSDPDMVNELRTHMMNAASPTPSVEALLHAFLPHRFIDHTHADAALALTNQPDGEAIVRKLYGGRVGIVPYIMPGFALAKRCAEIYEENPKVEGLILLKHGVFSMGETAEESYRRMIDIVSRAEDEIARRRKGGAARTPPAPADRDAASVALATIRRAYAERGFRAVLNVLETDEARAFAADPKLRDASQRGPLTPDHVIRTKAKPMAIAGVALGDRVAFRAAVESGLDAYAEDYRRYFETHAPRAAEKLTMLDPWPRVLLVEGLGVVTVGKTYKDAGVALDLYEHTVRTIALAEEIGRYEALPVEDLFDMEYWTLEQAKLGKPSAGPALRGKTAVVTGAASGIGRAVAEGYARAGACVLLMDRDEGRLKEAVDALGKVCKDGNKVRAARADVTSAEDVARAFREAALWTGGVDVVVQNAGVFPPSQGIDELVDADWSLAMRVNVDGARHVTAEALRWMKRNCAGGDIVVIASKNVPAPGKRASAYSVSKAAQTQLARVAALEGGPHGIRVNMLHPHMVFDTGIWTDAVLAERAKAYGLTVAEYKTNNLLKTEIASADVARAALALVDGSFSKTTGAQIPLDGGSDRTL